MYVEKLWKDFEETGNVETYLDLKEYERLHNEHTDSETTESIQQINESGLDGMK